MAQNSAPVSLLGKIAAYTELLEKDPYSTIFVPLSEAYRQMGMLDEAVEVVKKGIMENPAFATGYVALGRVYADQGLVEQSVGELEKALILENRHLPALKELAGVRLRQEDRGAARKLLEQAIRIKENDADVLKMLASLEVSRPPVAVPAPVVAEPEPEPVMSLAESVPLEKAVEPIATATIAEIYIRQGYPQKALKVYRDLLRAEPQNDQVRQKLVQLKQQIENEGLSIFEEESAVLAGAAETAVEPEATAVAPALAEAPEVLPAAMTTASAAAPVERSVADVLSAWLVAIRRRREAHV